MYNMIIDIKSLLHFISLMFHIITALPNITMQPSPAIFKAGDLNVTAMICKAVGIEPIHYQWERYHSLNGTWITPSHRAVDITSSNLKFSIITEEDGGLYRCIVTNDDGSVISNSATMFVYGEYL